MRETSIPKLYQWSRPFEYWSSKEKTDCTSKGTERILIRYSHSLEEYQDKRRTVLAYLRPVIYTSHSQELDPYNGVRIVPLDVVQGRLRGHLQVKGDKRVHSGSPIKDQADLL